MDERAVSPVIGTLMVLTILTVVTATMLTVVWPEVQDNRDRGEFGVVVTQLGAVASDSRQMASLGNVGELRQSSIAISSGRLFVDHGQLFAVSTTIAGERFTDVMGLTVDPDEHAIFFIDPGDPPVPVQATDSVFTVRYENGAGGAPAAFFVIDRFDGRRWVEDAPACGAAVAPGGDCAVDLGAKTLREGPWRVQARQGGPAGQLLGTVYLYEQNRVVYEQDGRRDRAATLENGALFSSEESTVLQLVPSLWQGGNVQGLGSALQARGTTFSAAEFPQASGRSTATFALTTLTHAHFAYQQGALHTRVQVLSGPQVDVWHRHLEHMAFEPDPEPGMGVVHRAFDESIDKVMVYPYSMLHVDLGLRMEVRS